VEFDPEWTPVAWGKSETLREGGDVVLLGLGTMVWVAMATARLLEQQGIQATVVNPRFVKPLDEETILELAARVGHLVTIEEAQLAGGFGSAVLELLSERGVDARVQRYGVPDRFIKHGTRAECLAAAGLTADQIAASVAPWMRALSRV